MIKSKHNSYDLWYALCYQLLVAHYVINYFWHTMLSITYCTLCYQLLLAHYVINYFWHIMLSITYCTLCYQLHIAHYVINYILHIMLSITYCTLRYQLHIAHYVIIYIMHIMLSNTYCTLCYQLHIAHYIINYFWHIMLSIICVTYLFPRVDIFVHEVPREVRILVVVHWNKQDIITVRCKLLKCYYKSRTSYLKTKILKRKLFKDSYSSLVKSVKLRHIHSCVRSLSGCCTFLT